MIHGYRTGLTALLIAIMVGVAAIGGFASQDRLLQDARFGLSGRTPTGQTALVEIDSRSLAEIGVWPWPRRLYAEVLDRLVEMDVADVAFDIDFSSASNPQDDALFAAALERAGGYAWLGAFVQRTTTDVRASLPLLQFLAHAEPAAVNVLLDDQGLVRQFVAGLVHDGGLIPSLASALSGRSVTGTPTVEIDYGIDANAFARFSFSDVLNGRVDPAALRDRNVIIGATAVELRDLFQTPRFGVMPGPVVQAMATETLAQDRGLKNFGLVPSAIGLAVLALFLVMLRRHLSIWPLGAMCLAAMFVWEGAAILAYLQFAVVMQTALFLLGVPALFVLELAAEVGTEVRQRQQAQSRLAYLATHDTTTGTLSRTGLVESLPTLGRNGTVILVKLRRLDTVRGTLGRDVCDALLAHVGRQLQSISSGLLAYVAQDTFAIGHPGSWDAEAVAALQDDILSRVTKLQQIGPHVIMIELRLAAATGVNNQEDLLRQAEIALLGGDPINRFEVGQVEAIEQRRQLDIDLRQAIGRGELHLVYQPQVDLVTREMVGVEALMRWTHPTHGPVPPAIFIPLAEETGYIAELGRWALAAACRDCAAWPSSILVGVNVSPAQLRLTDVLGDVAEALKSSGLPPDRLDLELTEGTFVETLAETQDLMQALRRMGVQVSLDDFGTGYSALSYLTTLPLDKIKIDQSFVKQIGTPADDALLHGIIDLCRRLGKKTLAEGIETDEQARQLAQWGCQTGQGYLFGKPADSIVITRMLADDRQPLESRA
ncbi:EAL domain-containing protein [Devosia oryziradicis]|uniref:EAL domain-containing protein n=1 Tax=Devosia oryziradicis TaxID=2801335 RepID=A0ABX7BSD5_9HYPH|nr:EAL domain-containing protein [Devosia oryziradicis]QQR34701.1 EAL domain-containing protein [Devosia oryziradicis]